MSAKYLLAGLGNMGEEYTDTRHNVGFKIVEALAAEASASFLPDRHAYRTSFRYKGKSVCLIKPTTFMNVSGKAVKYWLDKLEIPKENLLVIVDDIATPFGHLRIRSRGSDGNHNGLTSVEQVLQTTQYPRMRFGIGGDYAKGHQVNYVLGIWNETEKRLLPEKIRLACDAARSFITVGAEKTMSAYNKIGKMNEENNKS